MSIALDRYRKARIVAVVGMSVSAALCLGKVVIGAWAGSVALVADGVESGADLLAGGFLWASLWWASQPADEDHPYGHGRIENAAGLTIGVALVFTGGLIAWHSLAGIGDRPAPQAYALWPLIVSAVAKGALAVYKFRLGGELRSSSLMADAWNDTVDVVSAVTAGAGVAAAVWGPPGWAVADNLGGSVVGLIIVATGVRIIWTGLLELMDTQPEPELMERVRAVARAVPGVFEIETLRGRKSGLHYYFDLHIEVDPQMSVADSHRIAHEVKDAIRREVPEVADVLIHIEPAGQPRRSG